MRKQPKSIIEGRILHKILTEFFQKLSPAEQATQINEMRRTLANDKEKREAKAKAERQRLTYRTQGREVRIDKYGNFMYFDKKTNKKST